MLVRAVVGSMRVLLADSGGTEVTSVQGYVIIFTGFALFSVLFSYGIHYIDRVLRRMKRAGYCSVYKSLEREQLLLGIVSLLLSVLQDPLSTICVACTSTSQPFCIAAAMQQAGVSSHEPKDVGAPKMRRLASSSSASSCPPGKTQMFPPNAIHAMHILIFLIGGTHVVYLAVSMSIVIQKLRRWKPTEEHAMCAARHGLEIPIRSRYLIDLGDTPLSQWLLWLKGFVVDRVTKTTYLALRETVVEGLGITVDFDFRDYVTAAIEEEYAELFHVGWFEWVIAIVWIEMPYSVYVFSCLGILTSLVCAIKLNQIVSIMSAQAYWKHKRRRDAGVTEAPEAPPPEVEELKRPRLELERPSSASAAFRGLLRKSAAAKGAAGAAAVNGAALPEPWARPGGGLTGRLARSSMPASVSSLPAHTDAATDSASHAHPRSTLADSPSTEEVREAVVSGRTREGGHDGGAPQTRSADEGDGGVGDGGMGDDAGRRGNRGGGGDAVGASDRGDVGRGVAGNGVSVQGGSDGVGAGRAGMPELERPAAEERRDFAGRAGPGPESAFGPPGRAPLRARVGPLMKTIAGKTPAVPSEVHELNVQGPILMIPPGRLERWHRNAGIGAGAGSAKELELEALHEGDEGEFDPTSPKSHTRNSAEARRRASRSADRASHGAPATHATAQAAALSPAPLQGPAPAPGPSARPVGPTAAPQPRQGSRQEGLVSTDRHRPGSFLSRLSVKGQDLLHRVSRAVTRTKEEEGPSRREERGDGDGNGEEAGTAKAAMQRWMAGLFEVRDGQWSGAASRLRDADAGQLATYAVRTGMVRREQAGELERQLQEVIDKARKGRGGGDTGMTHVARKVFSLWSPRQMGRALSALTGRNRRGGGAGSASARAAEGPGTEEGDVETGLAGPARGGLRTGGRADRPSPPLQRVEGPAPLQGPRRHAWWRRWVEGVEWCLGVIPTATLDRGTGTVEEKKERVYASIAEREAAECAVRGVDDPSELFWLGRPVLVMWLLKFVFFENALSLALILLRTWTGVGLFGSHLDIGYAFIWFGVDLLLMVHSSWIVVPLYAIVSRVAASSRLTVLAYMAQNNLELDLSGQARDPQMRRSSSLSSSGPAGRKEAVLARATQGHRRTASVGAPSSNLAPAALTRAPSRSARASASEAEGGPATERELTRRSLARASLVSQGARSAAQERLGKRSASHRVLDVVLPRVTRNALKRHSATRLLGAIAASQAQASQGRGVPQAPRGGLDRQSAPARGVSEQLLARIADTMQGAGQPSDAGITAQVRGAAESGAQGRRAERDGGAGVGHAAPTSQDAPRVSTEGPRGDRQGSLGPEDIPLDLLMEKLGYNKQARATGDS